MRVIFVRDLKGQGKCKDVKEVSDGYAINYLIKNGYAVKYTGTSADILKHEIMHEEELDLENRKKALEAKEKLENVIFSFVVKSNNGKVFGSVSSKQIWEKLRDSGYDVDKKNIVIDGMVSTIGINLVKVNLYKDIYANVRIQLVSK